MNLQLFMFQEIKIVNNPTAKLDNLSVKRFCILRKDAVLKNPPTENVHIENSSSIQVSEKSKEHH